MRSPLSLPLWRFHRPFIWACDGSNNISITLKPNQAEEMLILPCTRCWGIGHVLQQVLFKSLCGQVYGNGRYSWLPACEALNTVDFQVVTVQGKRRC